MGLGLLHHDGAGYRERDGGGMEAVVDQRLQMSWAVMYEAFSTLVSRMHPWATRPFAPASRIGKRLPSRVATVQDSIPAGDGRTVRP